MTAPLNLALHRRLRRLFGAVRLANAGQAYVAAPVVRPDGSRRMEVDQEGEYYRVNCPYCRDTRFRLYVHHTYDRRDPHGRRSAYMAWCFNEDCLADPERQADLWERLTVGGQVAAGVLTPGRVVPPELRETTLPGPCVRLDELPAAHPACDYLAGRGYDPARLGRAYGVSYCTASRFFLAARRIIAPVVQGGALRGWQARHVGDLAWKSAAAGRHELPPKWWSAPGMHKSHLVYNLDAAARYRTLVVVEGPADVWGFGPMAGGTFGKSLSDTQADLIAARFPAPYPVVLLWDPDAFALTAGRPDRAPAVEAAAARLRARLGDRLAVVRLPDGTDPGSLGRRPAREYVADHARAQGVRVDYRER